MRVRVISAFILMLWCSIGFATYDVNENLNTDLDGIFSQQNSEQLLEEIEHIHYQLKALEAEGTITNKAASVGFSVLASIAYGVTISAAHNYWDSTSQGAGDENFNFSAFGSDNNKSYNSKDNQKNAMVDTMLHMLIAVGSSAAVDLTALWKLNGEAIPVTDSLKQALWSYLPATTFALVSKFALDQLESDGYIGKDVNGMLQHIKTGGISIAQSVAYYLSLSEQLGVQQQEVFNLKLRLGEAKAALQARSLVARLLE